MDKNILPIFVEELNDSQIDYAILDGSNMLDSIMLGKNTMSIAVKIDQYKEFSLIARKYARHVIHPCSKSYGWLYLYGLPEIERWRIKIKDDLFIDVYLMLSCRGLQKCTLVPLDKALQEYLWNNRVFDTHFRCWFPDKNLKFIYLMTILVFNENHEYENLQGQLALLAEIIDYEIVKSMLDKVFFAYTDTLICFARNKDFNQIRDRYIAFVDY
ncbi:MAG: hypothetical protein LUG93_14595 [Lachnospiraceae bacterium]|nr:hypothetical protein [Lachnospiraceae bacterium]